MCDCVTRESGFIEMQIALKSLGLSLFCTKTSFLLDFLLPKIYFSEKMLTIGFIIYPRHNFYHRRMWSCEISKSRMVSESLIFCKNFEDSILHP